MLESLRCDLIIEEQDSTQEALRHLDRFLLRVKPGDQIVVQDLLAFMKSTQKLALLLRDLLELDASIVVAASPEAPIMIRPEESAIAALTLLAAHESRRIPASMIKGSRRINSTNPNQLSKHQIAYARRLHADGESLRAIGLLFRISPQEVSEIVSR